MDTPKPKTGNRLLSNAEVLEQIGKPLLKLIETTCYEDGKLKPNGQEIFNQIHAKLGFWG